MMKNEGGFFQKVFIKEKAAQSLVKSRAGH